jgi:hypothetical protein
LKKADLELSFEGHLINAFERREACRTSSPEEAMYWSHFINDLKDILEVDVIYLRELQLLYLEYRSTGRLRVFFLEPWIDTVITL